MSDNPPDAADCGCGAGSCWQVPGWIAALPTTALSLTSMILTGIGKDCCHSPAGARGVILPITAVALVCGATSIMFLECTGSSIRKRADFFDVTTRNDLRLRGRVCTAVSLVLYVFALIAYGSEWRSERDVQPMVVVAFLSYFAAFVAFTNDTSECRKLLPRPDTKKKAQAAVTPATTVAEQPRPAWNLGDKLQQLKDAKDRGLLSDDEYEVAKQKAIENVVAREAVC